MTAWLGPADGTLTEQVTTSSATTTAPVTLRFMVPNGDQADLDDIRVVGSDLANTTTTMAYDSGNKLTSQTCNGVTATLGYDGWARLTSRTQGGYSATYGWRYGGTLYSVTSTFPGEGSETIATRGDGKRHSRTVGGAITQYRWDEGYTVLSEESGTGTLQRTFAGHTLAHVDGSNPSTGTWLYYLHDHLGSVRELRNAAKTAVGGRNYLPYGEHTDYGTFSTTRGFTGHDWDPTAQLYYAPYRYYSPVMARWLSRDPLGMVDGPNVYAYVQGNPVGHVDRDGRLLGLVGLGLVAAGAVGAWFFYCASRANDIAMKTPTSYMNYRAHCVFGCEFAKCMGPLGTGWFSYFVNYAFELYGGWKKDSEKDNEAAFEGGVAGATANCGSCQDICLGKADLYGWSPKSSNPVIFDPGDYWEVDMSR